MAHPLLCTGLLRNMLNGAGMTNIKGTSQLCLKHLSENLVPLTCQYWDEPPHLEVDAFHNYIILLLTRKSSGENEACIILLFDSEQHTPELQYWREGGVSNYRSHTSMMQVLTCSNMITILLYHNRPELPRSGGS